MVRLVSMVVKLMKNYKVMLNECMKVMWLDVLVVIVIIYGVVLLGMIIEMVWKMWLLGRFILNGLILFVWVIVVLILGSIKFFDWYSIFWVEFIWIVKLWWLINVLLSKFGRFFLVCFFVVLVSKCCIRVSLFFNKVIFCVWKCCLMVLLIKRFSSNRM